MIQNFGIRYWTIFLHTLGFKVIFEELYILYNFSSRTQKLTSICLRFPYFFFLF